jgi:hypothetical protein
MLINCEMKMEQQKAVMAYLMTSRHSPTATEENKNSQSGQSTP